MFIRNMIVNGWKRFITSRQQKKEDREKNGARYYDYNLVACVLLLTCFGLVMLYSASSYSAQVDFGDDMYYLKRQAVYSLGAFLIMILISKIDYHKFSTIAFYVYVFSNGLIFITRFIAPEIYGAHRWIRIGGVSIQTAEFGKISVILFLASAIDILGKKVKNWKAFCSLLGCGMVTSALTLFFTENLSTAIIIAGITVGLLFLVYPKKRPFIIGAVVLAVLVVAVVMYAQTLTSSDSFRMRRIITWLNPEANESSGGYQIMQGLYALGSGGFFGKGLGNSLQKLDFVPEAQNDMILTIIGEELGIFGIFVLTMLFVFLLYRLFYIAQNAPDLMGFLIVSGVFIHIALQVILNIAVVTNSIPTTGITLPFISNGGSAVVILMAEIGLALSVAGQIRLKEE